MATIEEQIEALEKEMHDTPYNKSTEHHHGLMRAKLSKLKGQQIDAGSGKSGGGGGYAVKKQGDATIVLVGPPSVGKSTLINKLTNAQSKIAPYAFTTLTVIPGMMMYKDAYIQILDVPGLIEGADEGKGRGKEVLSVVRNSDLLLIMCDIGTVGQLKRITDELERSGIRINKPRPQVRIEKKLKGGVQVISNVRQDLTKETVIQIAKEFRYGNAEITLKEKLTLDELVDAFSKNRVYVDALYAVNKADEVEDVGILIEKEGYDFPVSGISAEKNIGLDSLRDMIWQKLQFVRVYLVRRDENPSFANSQIMKAGSTLKDVAEKIGPEFAASTVNAVIWGAGAKFPGQKVSLSTIIQEGMQIRFI